jgi:hypothetical protein
MVKAAAILVGSLVVLGACASTAPPRIVYDKPGVSDADRQRDERECATASIGTARPDLSLGMIRIDRDAVDSCMKARGYTPRPAS